MRLTHKASGNTVDVGDDVAAVYLENGWEVVENEPKRGTRGTSRKAPKRGRGSKS
ncbi:DUF7302 family protein [Dermabacter hominis]|uniref:DUF7302 family protein n=1 Tax=Dermabacter hominis TaxID=36740 RepID=UPI003C6C9087